MGDLRVQLMSEGHGESTNNKEQIKIIPYMYPSEHTLSTAGVQLFGVGGVVNASRQPLVVLQ